MPNWVDNELKVEINNKKTIIKNKENILKLGALVQIKKFKEGANGDGVGVLDFNKFVPCPESLHITESSDTDKGLAVVAFEKDGDREELDK